MAKKRYAAEVILRDADVTGDDERKEVADWLRQLADRYEKNSEEFGHAFSVGYYVKEIVNGREGRDTRSILAQDAGADQAQEPRLRRPTREHKGAG